MCNDEKCAMSTAEESLRMCHLFEAELLLELMLRFWQHPCADDIEFRNDLIERATEVLQASVDHEQFIDGLPPSQMNFVAAVWYAESTTIQTITSDLCVTERNQRNQWLNALRSSLPSCFCNQDDLQT